jgi:hypothetical protein
MPPSQPGYKISTINGWFDKIGSATTAGHQLQLIRSFRQKLLAKVVGTITVPHPSKGFRYSSKALINNGTSSLSAIGEVYVNVSV